MTLVQLSERINEVLKACENEDINPSDVFVEYDLPMDNGDWCIYTESYTALEEGPADTIVFTIELGDCYRLIH